MDLNVRSEQVYENEDRRWMAHRKGFDTARSIMLDVSTFTVDHVSIKGALPSGTALAETGTAGYYKPHTPAVDTLAGFLLNTTKIGDGSGTDLATAADHAVAMIWEGIVDKTYLPVPDNAEADGTIDAAAEANLPSIRFEES